jgi:hypothetical protein
MWAEQSHRLPNLTQAGNGEYAPLGSIRRKIFFNDEPPCIDKRKMDYLG